MRKTLIGLMALGLTASITAQPLSTNEMKRIQQAADVLNETRGRPDKDIPQTLWTKAKCVVVVPGLKRAAFVVGGEYGKGLASCRTADSWTPPSFFEIAKGSWGVQIGAAEIDLILLVMNERGMEKLLGNKFTLGAEAAVAAGPVGRAAQAATDAQMQAEILAWSRSRGLFAGVNLAGGVRMPDTESNASLYGKPLSARDILLDAKVPAPPEARAFFEALRRHDAVTTTTHR
jgi:SH3 domain-containing YSC84-like protein 1